MLIYLHNDDIKQGVWVMACLFFSAKYIYIIRFLIIPLE